MVREYSTVEEARFSGLCVALALPGTQ